ncbi:unnamed protein product, partial [marine sediment metagenome]
TDKASEYAEKAVQIDPTNAVAQDVLKKALLFSKGFRRRRGITDKALTRLSAYADTHFIHRFKVLLRDSPNIWRIIDIKGNQMLSSLHKAIFEAFDRFEEHQYSFFLSNKPYDRGSEYTSPGIGKDGTGKLASRIRRKKPKGNIKCSRYKMNGLFINNLFIRTTSLNEVWGSSAGLA